MSSGYGGSTIAGVQGNEGESGRGKDQRCKLRPLTEEDRNPSQDGGRGQWPLEQKMAAFLSAVTMVEFFLALPVIKPLELLPAVTMISDWLRPRRGVILIRVPQSGKTNTANGKRIRNTNTNPDSNHDRGGFRMKKTATPLFFFLSDGVRQDPTAVKVASLLNSVDGGRSCWIRVE